MESKKIKEVKKQLVILREVFMKLNKLGVIKSGGFQQDFKMVPEFESIRLPGGPVIPTRNVEGYVSTGHNMKVSFVIDY